MTLKLLAGSGGLLKGALKLNALFAVGAQLENKLRVDSGTLSFLAASATTYFVPTLVNFDVKFEGLAWTYFLQSALVLGLWAGESRSPRRIEKINRRKWIPILVVFLIGSLGSAIGGFLGFHAAKLSPDVCSGLFREDSLRVLSACLTASYIGGTVNFFETAKIAGATRSESMRSLVNLVAGIDIGVMVLYFWFLSAIRDSPLKKILPSRKTASGKNSTLVIYPELTRDVVHSSESRSRGMIPSKNQNTAVWKYFPPIIISSIITVTANFTQRKLSVPGVSVIFATIGAMGFQSFIYTAQIHIAEKLLLAEKKELMKLQDDMVQNNTILDSSSDIYMKNSDSLLINTKNVRTLSNLKVISKMKKLQMILNTFNEHSGSGSKYMIGLFYSTVGLGFHFEKIKSVQGPLGILLGVTLGCHLSIIIIGSVFWNFCILSIYKLKSQSQNRDGKISENGQNELKRKYYNNDNNIDFYDIASPNGDSNTNMIIDSNNNISNDNDESSRNRDYKNCNNQNSSKIIENRNYRDENGDKNEDDNKNDGENKNKDEDEGKSDIYDYLINMDTALIAR